jgi:hypothetical protein
MINRENRRPSRSIDYDLRVYHDDLCEYRDAAEMNIYLRIRSPSKRSYRMVPRPTVFYPLHRLFRMAFALCALRSAQVNT